jgi:hypothetical protein
MKTPRISIGATVGLAGGMLLLTACRAIIGVEELGAEADAASDTLPSAQKDAASPDTATSPEAAAPASTCADKGIECFRCCRDTHRQLVHDLERAGRAVGCLCEAGVCLTQCSGANGLCDPNYLPPPAEQCGACIDPVLAKCFFPPGTCTGGCATANECFKSCK